MSCSTKRREEKKPDTKIARLRDRKGRRSGSDSPEAEETLGKARASPEKKSDDSVLIGESLSPIIKKQASAFGEAGRKSRRFLHEEGKGMDHEGRGIRPRQKARVKKGNHFPKKRVRFRKKTYYQGR